MLIYYPKHEMPLETYLKHFMSDFARQLFILHVKKTYVSSVDTISS